MVASPFRKLGMAGVLSSAECGVWYRRGRWPKRPALCRCGRERGAACLPRRRAMLYRGMDRPALDAAYNNTAAVGQARRDAYVADWTKRSEAIRKTPGARLDLRYSGGPRQRLDVFLCGAPAASTLVYIHGGYWQMNDKEPYAFLGEGVLGAGFNLGLVEYTLAPAVRLDQIVSEVRRSVAWVIEHANEIGGHSARVYVSGHSAGGHLTA